MVDSDQVYGCFGKVRTIQTSVGSVKQVAASSMILEIASSPEILVINGVVTQRASWTCLSKSLVAHHHLDCNLWSCWRWYMVSFHFLSNPPYNESVDWLTGSETYFGHSQNDLLPYCLVVLALDNPPQDSQGIVYPFVGVISNTFLESSFCRYG